MVDPEDIAVTDLMARELFVAREEEDIHDAIQRMRYRGVRRLPVVDREGSLVGVVAVDDLRTSCGCRRRLRSISRLFRQKRTLRRGRCEWARPTPWDSVKCSSRPEQKRPLP